MRTFLSKPVFFFIIISVLFLGLRFFNLPQALNYGSDAARDFLVTWNMYVTKHPVLIGPPSEYEVIGRQFFFGPAPYYIILPALLIGHWDPLAVSYYLIILNLVVLLLSLSILNKIIKEKTIIYYFALFCTFTPSFITYTQSYWNPYFMLPVSLLLVAFIEKGRIKKNNLLLFLLIGFLFGLGLQFHYSFIFAIIISCIWLCWRREITVKEVGLLVGGFIIGFFPLILFELRNHFYNVNTMLLLLTHSSSSNTGFTFNSFYFISVFPFIFWLISFFLKKIDKSAFFFTYIFWALYIIWSLVTVLSPHHYPLSYPDAKKIAQKIEQDNPHNFNIVDQLTRDNKGTPIRYLLTVQGYPPQGLTEYANVPTIYIYSKVPLNNLLKTPIWEIKTFLPFNKAVTQKGVDGIYIYKLTKNL